MPEYRVNTIYHPGKTSWQPGTDFNYRSGCLELRLMFDRLTPSDIRAIRTGPARFHLAIVNDVLFFLFQFSTACPLSDNSYDWHLVSEEERTVPPMLGPGEGAILTIILVSAEDGIIRAIRQIALGHDFSAKLFDAIRAQIERPFSRQEHDRKIATVYAAYPTSQQLLTRATASCIVEEQEGRN